MEKITKLFPLFLGSIMMGCAGAKLTQTVQTAYVGPPVKVIALAPGGGPLADAIGIELFNKGLNLVDPERTKDIIGRVGLTDIQVSSPESYSALKIAGIDALLIVKAVMGYDGTPESASARLTSTRTSEVVAGITWQNGWGGQRGSIADRSMRKNLAEAADQIAKALIERLR